MVSGINMAVRGIYHIATFQSSEGGGAKIRLSTRLNKPKASRYPLVIAFPNPSHLCATRLSLAERAVSGKAGGVSLVASFIR